MEDLEENHENLFTCEQSELRKEMAKLQTELMMETVSVVYINIYTVSVNLN